MLPLHFVLCDNFFSLQSSFFFSFLYIDNFLVGLPIICLLTRKIRVPLLCMGRGSLRTIQRLRTRSAAVRHWCDFSLSAYERDLVTNEKVTVYFSKQVWFSNRKFQRIFRKINRDFLTSLVLQPNISKNFLLPLASLSRRRLQGLAWKRSKACRV